MHGGNTPKARARAEAQQIMKALGNDIDGNVDPAEALLWLCSTKQAEVHWLRAKVREVEDTAGGQDALTWGVTQHDEGVGPDGPIDKTTSTAEANVWWRLLREAEDQLARYSSMALKAGVQQRQIDLQEAQALHLAGAINRILDALELSAEQARLVSTVVPEVLRSLPVGEGK